VGAWSYAVLLPEFVLMLTATVMLVAELLRRGWRWNEAAVQPAWWMISVVGLMATAWAGLY